MVGGFGGGGGGEPPSLLNRIFGGVRAISGGLQAAGGVTLAGGGTVGTGGLGTVPAVVAGGLITARGADDVQAGLRQLITGQNVNSLTHDAVKGLTGNEALATGVDFGTGLISGGGAAKAIAAAAAAKEAQAAADIAAAIKTGCFVAGTMIQTRDGEKAIQDIQIGDWVLSDDPSTPGEIEYKQVVQTFIHETNYLVDVYIGGEKITTTEGHRFWVKDVGWVAAKDLGAGADLQTKTEAWLGIDRVEKHTEVATVYNFEVQGFHTYFVSDLGLLVHNGCPDFPKGAWIARDTFQSLAREAGSDAKKKFISALQKSIDGGTVAPTNSQGIKVLTGTVNGYTHELKINNSAARILGKFDEETGVLVFDKFLPKGLH